MILKVEDALKPFSRTDPECAAHRDLPVIFPTAACDIKIIHRLIPRQLCCKVVNFENLFISVRFPVYIIVFFCMEFSKY